MVLLNSQSLTLGSPAPSFNLPSVDGKHFSLNDFREAKALVIMFICNHCPYVKAVEDRIILLNREYAPKGVQFVGICSNDPTDYPDDAPENLLKRWRKKQYGFPYLIDESQDVARAYGAVCTPDIYVYDHHRHLRYHGRIDDNWQDPGKVTRHEMAEALEAILQGETPQAEQNSTMGCSIKWRKS